MSSESHQVSQLIEQELDLLWRFAWRLTGDHDDARDLVQRTCLRALERSHTYNAKGKLRSWLMRIEHRIWLNELRSRQIRQNRDFSAYSKPSPPSDAEEIAAVDGQGFLAPESNLMLHQVHEVVESLPEAQRLVLLLVCVEGFSYRETAEILELPIGTVMSRLARARIAIGQQVLEKSADSAVTTRRTSRSQEPGLR